MNVIQGDAIQTIAAMPEASVDAVIADPPYCSGSIGEAQRVAAKGQGLRSENIKKLGWFVGDNMGTAGLLFLLRAMMWESQRVLKPNGSALVFCDWRMVPNVAPAIESCGFRFQNLIVWDKGTMGLGNGFRAQHEIILHFTNGAPEYHDRGTPNVIKCKRVTAAERVHQTEKPVDLIEQLIRVVCPPGGVVLDPFGGSGTTAVAAHNVGRDAILIERDPAHVATAWERIAEAIMQPPRAAA
ncbi:MAG TPA: site-specific DNA-methyltransferase [Acidimicrobiales bacterium]|nr:site-specific DNA-methyltransferase [Acidimicrobiales bacterium]